MVSIISVIFLFFNIYQKQFGQILTFIKSALFVHWCLSITSLVLACLKSFRVKRILNKINPYCFHRIS